MQKLYSIHLSRGIVDGMNDVGTVSQVWQVQGQ